MQQAGKAANDAATRPIAEAGPTQGMSLPKWYFMGIKCGWQLGNSPLKTLPAWGLLLIGNMGLAQ